MILLCLALSGLLLVTSLLFYKPRLLFFLSPTIHTFFYDNTKYMKSMKHTVPTRNISTVVY